MWSSLKPSSKLLQAPVRRYVKRSTLLPIFDASYLRRITCINRWFENGILCFSQPLAKPRFLVLNLILAGDLKIVVSQCQSSRLLSSISIAIKMEFTSKHFHEAGSSFKIPALITLFTWVFPLPLFSLRPYTAGVLRIKPRGCSVNCP